LKPVVAYHWANPHALEWLLKPSFYVNFSSSKEGQITGQVLSKYIKKNTAQLPSKILQEN
jgi:hypothetical protein